MANLPVDFRLASEDSSDGAWLFVLLKRLINEPQSTFLFLVFVPARLYQQEMWLLLIIFDSCCSPRSRPFGDYNIDGIKNLCL